MHQSIISALLFAPLAVLAVRHRSDRCPARQSTVTHTYTVTATDLPLTPTLAIKLSTTFVTSAVSSRPTVSTSVPSEEQPSEVPVKSQSSTLIEEQSSNVSEDIPTSTSTLSEKAVSATVDSQYADATPADVGVPATDQCGLDDRVIFPGLAWTVANSMYNGDQMQGSQCTNFSQVLKASDGTLLVEWTSRTDIDLVDSTKNLCKGYSNIGIGKNLKKPLSSIKSIPTYYKWDRTIDGDFKGSNFYDFITSPTQGAGEVPGSNEFMLFLKIWGGQVPIGYAQGPVNTFNLYGMTWKLYEGKNEGNGQMVRSLIPDTPFEGEFSGDLKVWLDAMADAGYCGKDEYVNIGNTGIEVFYGNSVQKATVALDINL